MTEDERKKSINRAYRFNDEQQTALDEDRISEAEWFEIHNNYFSTCYLAATNPRAQSGYSGDEERWRYARGIILHAVHRNGTFMDIGCANGYLIECLSTWLTEAHRTVAFYGLDISHKLIDLAKRRLPHWQDHLFVGNALFWTPTVTYNFVRTSLEYVPNGRQKHFVAHLLSEYVSTDGRLIIEFNEYRQSEATTDKLRSWGHVIAGSYQRAKSDNTDVCYKVVWIDNP